MQWKFRLTHVLAVARNFLLSFALGGQGCCLSVLILSFIMFLLPFPSHLLSSLPAATLGCLDVPFHFFCGFFLSLLSSSVCVSLHLPLMRQSGALQSCPLEAMGWWPASYPCFPHTAGTELLVAACPGLWPNCGAL